MNKTYMNKNRTKKAFTLVELLVVVVVIGALSAIALPNFVGAAKAAKSASIKGSMRMVQIAAEAYSTDSGGQYSTLAGAWMNYLPGGGNTLTGTKGTLPINLVTGTVPASLQDAGLGTSLAIQTQRLVPAAGVAGTALPGDPAYCQGDNGNTYAVTGSDSDGNYISGNGGFCLVLSNQ